MSRYSLRPHRYLPQLFEVAIGWDPSFATYFACAYGQPDDNGDPVIIRHIGLGWRDVEHPEAVIAFARPLARIPSDIFRRLTLDARRCPPTQTPPTAAIAAITAMNAQPLTSASRRPRVFQTWAMRSGASRPG